MFSVPITYVSVDSAFISLVGIYMYVCMYVCMTDIFLELV